MAVGKNKRLTKSKKGGKKKIIDPFTRKDWYDVKVPSMFSQRIAGKTLINRTQGTHIASEGLKGLVFECNLADLNKNEEQSFRKLKFICEDVQSNTCVTNFHGMDMTRDKLCSLVKKWKTLIEAFVDVKTLDGYLVRLFVIGFTKKRQNQIKKTCYAQSSQVRQIRKKMVEVMTEEATKCDLKGLFAKLIPEHIGKQIERSTKLIFPLENVFVRKVKILKKPKFDLTKLMELHGDNAGKEDQGTKVDREEPAMVESMPGAGGRL